jgi:transposase InsO family protein
MTRPEGSEHVNGIKRVLSVLTLINLLGAPKRIHSDNAAEYSSEAMQQIYRTHNILHTTITPYTPYGNGKSGKYFTQHSQISLLKR